MTLANSCVDVVCIHEQRDTDKIVRERARAGELGAVQNSTLTEIVKKKCRKRHTRKKKQILCNEMGMESVEDVTF